MAYGRVLLVLLAIVAAGASFRCGGDVPSPEPATPTASPALGPPPALLGLEPFYQKYLDAGGIPVVSSSDVSDETLVRVAATLDEMLVQRPEMREAIVASGARIAVLAADEPATSLPEYRYRAREDPDWTTFDGRAMSTMRGLGPTRWVPVTVIGEELVLCHPDQSYRQDSLVHEVGHLVLNLGVEAPTGTGGFRQQLGLLLGQALQQGLWVNTYSATNADEYWAVAVQAWFDVGGSLNGVDTREELEAYDPRIARLVQEVFGDATLSSSCYLGAYPDTEVRRYVVQGVVLGPDDVPLSGIVVWAFLGEDVAGASRTDAAGSFTLLASDGEMNIAFCTREGEEVAFGGWHGGEDGLTPWRGEATPVVVSGESVTGMVIKLPADHGITEC